LDIEIDTRNLIVIAAEIDDFHFLQERLNVKGIEKLISSFIDISTEILKDMGKAVISNIEDEKFIIIFSLGSMRSKLEIHNYIIAAIDRIKASIKRYLNITASFSISSPIDSIVSLSGCYKEAEKALEDKFYKGKDTILQGKLESKPEDEIFNLNINDEKNIISCLKSIDRKNLQMYIDTLFNKIVLYKMSQRAIRMVCAELINIVNTVARESGIDTKLIYQDDEIPYDEMKKYETISEVELWILKVYEKFLRLMEVSSINPDYAEPTKKAIEFIRKNYRNNISLNDAADYTGVNSSYLSRVFKKDCGRGFNEYLNYVRVEQAKLLIQSGNNKLKDIVKNVGFNNYTYFFKVFKDFIGMTPQEYEEIIKKESALECS
jgi:two-component system response regulator YesN